MYYSLTCILNLRNFGCIWCIRLGGWGSFRFIELVFKLIGILLRWFIGSFWWRFLFCLFTEFFWIIVFCRVGGFFRLFFLVSTFLCLGLRIWLFFWFLNICVFYWIVVLFFFCFGRIIWNVFLGLWFNGWYPIFTHLLLLLYIYFIFIKWKIWIYKRL